MKLSLALLLLIVFCQVGFAQTPQSEKTLPSISPDVSEELRSAFESGNEAFAARRYDEALQTYERALKLAPNEPALWVNKALALLERGTAAYNSSLVATEEGERKEKKENAFKDFREAVRAASRAQELVKAVAPPTEPAFRNAYDTQLIGSSGIYARALAIMTTNVDASFLPATVDALNAYITLETDAERKKAALAQLSYMLLTNRRYHEAFSEYQKILQTDPSNVDASVGAAVSLLSLGHLVNDANHIQDGLNLLARFIELAPDKHRLKSSAKGALSYLRQASTPPSSAESKAEPKGTTVYGTLTPPASGDDRAAINGGVVNGKAITLPRPNYPLIASFAQATGTVAVQVVIDEDGGVTSARAISGHPLLQAVSVAAAQEARFSTTYLSGKPVRVSGLITYNFVVQP